MNPTKILWLQILAVCATVLVCTWAATEWTAWKLAFQPELGRPWFRLLGWPVYVPVAFFWWWFAFDAYAHAIFVTGGFIAGTGGLAAFIVAIAISIWRAHEVKKATTYGSARWASAREIRKAGLLEPDGVVLGHLHGSYLRHNGPEHVLCFAPTRSGKGVGLVVPTLLTWPGSAIVHDIKGENWSLTAGWRQRFGRVVLFDPTNARSSALSPLLSNIALSAIEERYERWTYHRTKIQDRRTSDGATAARAARSTDRTAGRCVFFPVRYADDFVVLVSGTQAQALAEKAALAEHLRRVTGLELSPEKTKVTAVTNGFEFLGFHVTMRWMKRYGYGPRIEIPKAKATDLRRRIKQLTGPNTTWASLEEKLQELNYILRGWANYYRYCPYAGRVFTSLDWYISDRIWRWLRRKHPKANARDILAARQTSRRRVTRRLWRAGNTEQYLLGWTTIERYRLAWMKMPDFALSSGEPDA